MKVQHTCCMGRICCVAVQVQQSNHPVGTNAFSSCCLMYSDLFEISVISYISVLLLLLLHWSAHTTRNTPDSTARPLRARKKRRPCPRAIVCIYSMFGFVPLLFSQSLTSWKIISSLWNIVINTYVLKGRTTRLYKYMYQVWNTKSCR